MRSLRLLTALTVLALPGCGAGDAEHSESAGTAATISSAPGADVGTPGNDATAVPISGDSAATAASHP